MVHSGYRVCTYHPGKPQNVPGGPPGSLLPGTHPSGHLPVTHTCSSAVIPAAQISGPFRKTGSLAQTRPVGQPNRRLPASPVRKLGLQDPPGGLRSARTPPSRTKKKFSKKSEKIHLGQPVQKKFAPADKKNFFLHPVPTETCFLAPAGQNQPVQML